MPLQSLSLEVSSIWPGHPLEQFHDLARLQYPTSTCSISSNTRVILSQLMCPIWAGAAYLAIWSTEVLDTHLMVRSCPISH
jgi:hypothetical protein